jgi:hypothetical protein
VRSYKMLMKCGKCLALGAACAMCVAVYLGKDIEDLPVESHSVLIMSGPVAASTTSATVTTFTTFGSR